MKNRQYIDIVLVLRKNILGPIYLDGLTLILAWMSNYIHYKVWGEIHSQTSTSQRFRMDN